tara:strand:- start:14323 stop:14655 length:333 start_codon:yes stop_codon:yes gene_type:complete
MFKGIIVRHKTTGKIWVAPYGPVGQPKWTYILTTRRHNTVTSGPAQWAIGGDNWRSEKEINDDGWLPMVFATGRNKDNKREIYKVIRSQFRTHREEEMRTLRRWNARSGV